jgi:hypothetical protein
VYRERKDYLIEYSDGEVFDRFRFRKPDIDNIVEIIGDDLEHGYQRKGCLSPHQQLLLALRFYATGSLQVSE